MRIMTLPRGGGKTFRALKEAAENYYYFVCFNQDECKRIKELAKKSGFDIPDPITFEAVMAGKLQGRDVNGIVIDNLDLILLNLTKGADIKLVTITGDPK